MRKLVVIAPRYPTLLERLLLGIVCVGHCAGNLPENIASCHRSCLPKRLLNGNAIKQLPP